MKYILGIICALLALWLLQTSGVIMAMVLFLIAGAIPGTHLLMPPVLMFILLGLLLFMMGGWIVAAWIQERHKVRHKTTAAEQPKTNPPSATLRRRFTQLQA